MKYTLVFLISIVLFSSCGPSTKIVTAWHEPGVTIQTNADKRMVVMAFVKDEGSRRIIEDQLVKRLNGKGAVSYTFINEAMIKENESAFEERVKRDKYDYVLMMRLSNVENETTYVQGSTTSYYGGYGRYYRYSAPMYYDPGHYQTNKNFIVETTVYDVLTNKLIWASSTKTVNPEKMDKTINEIATVVSDRMRRDGFLK